ncbi:DUF350 domain-containing protein [Actinomadura parmotrematis]|uniref:DUF350 domain-containing protein n=1 Tax=Actinomadura parmotrematis TaxID=2864039 RepID=A0ABS7FTS3_9ACTN|nr:DUF350 domain-containing protein [Actinomadura parmotrematis]MBW8483595.1 DUF350 domain-containing protein [Actinomadura parmotrematis]
MTILAATDNESLGHILLEGSGALLAYAGVGLVLFVVGFYMTDLAVPGRLITVIREHRNPNATLLACASTVGVGLIVAVSIFASGGDLAEGLTRTAVFGAVGIVAQTLATMIFDRAIGIKVRSLADDAEDALEPAAILLAVANLMIGFVVAVATY